MTELVRRIVLGLGAVGVAGLVVLTGAPQAVEKSVFVSVVDANGRPVTDLKVNELGVREDNVIREVVAVKPVTTPLVIQILADTSKETGPARGRLDGAAGGADLIRDIRVSLTAFVKRISASSPQSTIGLMEFGQASVPVTKLTTNHADVEKGITRLFTKPDAASVLLEAIIESSKMLQKIEGRKAILILNVEPGDEQSREPPQRILDTFRDAGASMWAVSIQRGDLKNPARDLILQRLTQVTGGRREFLVAQSALERYMNDYADALLNQIEIVFRRPDGRPVQLTEVGTTRQGVKLFWRYFAPK
jgi:hypothetical protein